MGSSLKSKAIHCSRAFRGEGTIPQTARNALARYLYMLAQYGTDTLLTSGAKQDFMEAASEAYKANGGSHNNRITAIEALANKLEDTVARRTAHWQEGRRYLKIMSHPNADEMTAAYFTNAIRLHVTSQIAKANFGLPAEAVLVPAYQPNSLPRLR